MPIYEYRCSSCGFEKEYLQRVSDPRLTKCPECGKATFEKLMSAAGFQLKGSGWYVTDFKNGSDKPKADKGKPSGESTESKSESKSDKPADTKKEGKSESEPARGTGTGAATSS